MTAKCSWCGNIVTEEAYSEHLDMHYKFVGGKRVGPYPQQIYVTPWSDDLEIGVYEVEMPLTIRVGGKLYEFSKWEDDSVNPVRQISLVSDITITATYEVDSPEMETLIVNSAPEDTQFWLGPRAIEGG